MRIHLTAVPHDGWAAAEAQAQTESEAPWPPTRSIDPSPPCIPGGVPPSEAVALCEDPAVEKKHVPDTLLSEFANRDTIIRFPYTFEPPPDVPAEEHAQWYTDQKALRVRNARNATNRVRTFLDFLVEQAMQR